MNYSMAVGNNNDSMMNETVNMTEETLSTETIEFANNECMLYERG